jgi:hypothetical protein
MPVASVQPVLSMQLANAYASVQPALIPETLKLASGFEKWWMIWSIPDIEGRKFEESTI